MLMRGDLNKIIVEVNRVIESLADRVVALEDKVAILESEKGSKPSGSKASKPVAEKSEAA